MTDPSQMTATDYGIHAEPLMGRVTAYRNGTVIAASEHAMVLYETRLPPALYFPRSDIKVQLDPTSDLRTFCPFKGTATYSHLDADGERVENAAWAYNRAISDGRDIEGLVSFMPGVITDLDLGENILHQTDSGNITGPLVDWVMREAWLCKTPEDLTGAIARKLIEDGVALTRISVLIWSLHPLIAGRNIIWTKEKDEVESYRPSYDLLTDPRFVNSPMRHVSNGLGGVRQRLDQDEAEFSFPIMSDLRAAGATDYVAMPLPFSNGQINVMTLTGDHPEGFSTPRLGLIFESSFALSRFYEVFALKENAQSLLETYLGKRTGARVLGGEIRRGDGDEIDAAILFCDLRHSSALEEKLGRAAYLDLLNGFFEGTTEIINDNGGEVLKFIGDAVLAIFPAGEDAQAASTQALESAKQIVKHFREPAGGNGATQPTKDIDCAIGIDFGRVTYGNIGSQERLDFTVIGKAANVAARLAEYGKPAGHRIVASAAIASGDGDAQSLGALDLHNVSEPVKAMAIGK